MSTINLDNLTHEEIDKLENEEDDYDKIEKEEELVENYQKQFIEDLYDYAQYYN